MANIGTTVFFVSSRVAVGTNVTEGRENDEKTERDRERRRRSTGDVSFENQIIRIRSNDAVSSSERLAKRIATSYDVG